MQLKKVVFFINSQSYIMLKIMQIIQIFYELNKVLKFCSGTKQGTNFAGNKVRNQKFVQLLNLVYQELSSHHWLEVALPCVRERVDGVRECCLPQQTQQQMIWISTWATQHYIQIGYNISSAIIKFDSSYKMLQLNGTTSDCP